MRLLLALALVAATTAATTAVAAADPATDAFGRAAQQMADGRHAEAAAGFESLARRYPDSELADDALAKAAQLYEQRLGQLDRAISLYREVIRRFPDTRLASRAEVRLAALETGMGDDPGDAAALAELELLLGTYADRDPGETIARMRRLVESYPEAPAAIDARIWLGGAYHRDGWLEESLRWYREAQRLTDDPETRRRARKAEGDVLLAGGRYDDARAAYRSLYDSGLAMHKLWADQALARVDQAQRRARLSRLAWLVVLAFVLLMIGATWRVTGSLPAAARALGRPPVELYYLAPIALFVGAVSWRSNELAAEAIGVLFAGALVVTWLNGAALDAARRASGRVTLARVGFHVLVAGAAVLAICYIALMRERLLDLVIETWRAGPEL